MQASLPIKANYKQMKNQVEKTHAERLYCNKYTTSPFHSIKKKHAGLIFSPGSLSVIKELFKAFSSKLWFFTGKKKSLLFLFFIAKVLDVNCQENKGLETSTRRPNILFIAVDDLRPQLGCYGDPIVKSPNIDKLAESGVTFNRAYCQQAVCSPSRTSLMTGRRPNTTKVWDLKTHFRTTMPDVVTLPQYFKNNGYHTRSIGKIYHDPAAAQDALSWSAPEIMAPTPRNGKYVLPVNLIDKSSPKAAASEIADVPDNAYIDGQVADKAVDVLGEIKGKPFFLAIGFRRPHLPFSAPKKYWDLYTRSDIPLPAQKSSPTNVPVYVLHNSGELKGYTDIGAENPISEDKSRELIHGYYAAISYVDAQIGKVMAELDRLGLTKNTIVVLWSDHGFHLGEKGLWTKTTNYELDTRVPLIISAPGKNQSSRSEGLVELVDLYPTLAQLSELPVPDGLEGTSVVPLLTNPNLPWKKAAFSQFPRPWQYKGEPELMGYAVRTNTYRYVEWRSFKTNEVKSSELYDLEIDPAGMNNIVNVPGSGSVVRDLKQILNAGWKSALPKDVAK